MLGRPVDSFAYPYGEVDPALAHLIGACGYTHAVTCYAGHSRIEDSPLELPRIEVDGTAGFDAFIRRLES